MISLALIRNTNMSLFLYSCSGLVIAPLADIRIFMFTSRGRWSGPLQVHHDESPSRSFLIHTVRPQIFAQHSEQGTYIVLACARQHASDRRAVDSILAHSTGPALFFHYYHSMPYQA